MSYEMIIGLEVHAELKTRTKIFCACENRYGAEPNTCVCPTCMGLPGALPVLNEQAVYLAAKAGKALGCAVHPLSRFDRKNYFYPDLPKAYQITQFFHPICTGGGVDVEGKTIGITRIHLEEDAGKLTHGADGTFIDLNRCGVPLIEIVSEPDIRTAKEAVAYLRKLRAILLYAGISDCRMNEGSLRCDVNLSIHRPGEPWGTRTEMKNLNSFQSVERAIEAEYRRQVEAVEKGEIIRQETRRYDQKTGLTYAMRTKETSADYRYFPEPDLPWIASPQIPELPRLPDEWRKRFIDQYGLSPYVADQLIEEPWLAQLYDRAASMVVNPIDLGNLMLGLPHPLHCDNLARLCDMMTLNQVNSTTGKKILSLMLESDFNPVAYAKEHHLFTLRDEEQLSAIVQEVLKANPDLVKRYLSGKTKVAQALIGQAMAQTGGRADAEMLRAITMKALAEWANE